MIIHLIMILIHKSIILLVLSKFLSLRLNQQCACPLLSHDTTDNSHVDLSKDGVRMDKSSKTYSPVLFKQFG